MVNRNVGPGKKMVLLVRTDIHRIIQKICPDPTIVEEGVSLGWSSIANDRLSCSLCGYQELKEGSFRFADPFSEARIGVQVVDTGCELPLFQSRNPDMRRPSASRGVAGI